MAKIQNSPELSEIKELAFARETRRCDVELMLLALAQMDDSVAAGLLRDSGFEPAVAKERIDAMMLQRHEPPYSNGYFILGTVARRVAHTFHSKCINSEHLLFALLCRHRDGAYSLLGELGVNRERLRNKVIAILEERMHEEIRDRLIEKQNDIRFVLAQYGAQNVRICGSGESESASEPDVDVIIVFERQGNVPPVLVCHRNSYLRRMKGQNSWDRSGYLLCNCLRKVIGYPVNVAWESAVKNFYPKTYKRTLATHNWSSENPF